MLYALIEIRQYRAGNYMGTQIPNVYGVYDSLDGICAAIDSTYDKPYHVDINELGRPRWIVIDANNPIINVLRDASGLHWSIGYEDASHYDWTSYSGRPGHSDDEAAYMMQQNIVILSDANLWK